MPGRRMISSVLTFFLMTFVACVPVHAAVPSDDLTTPTLGTVDTTRRVPEGHRARITLRVRNSAGYEVTSTSITARGRGRTLHGRHTLQLPRGTWKVERAATVHIPAQSIYHPSIPGTAPTKLSQAVQNPTPGQCSIANIGLFTGSPAVVGPVTIACPSDGVLLTGTATPFYIGIALVPDRAFTGRDVAEWAADPSSYLPDSPVKTLSGVYWVVSGVKPGTQETPAWEEIVQPGPDIQLRSRTTVKVTEYNPGCVSGPEFSRLRIQMARSQWHRIIGGTGFLESRVAGGYETRSYLGCSWSGPDLSIVYQGGKIIAWQVM